MKKTLDTILRIFGGITLLLLAIWLFNRATGQEKTYKFWEYQHEQPAIEKSPLGKFFDGYRITWGKVVGWTGFGIAGAAWGAREAYHADLKVFEKRWGVDPYSFFGSEAWQRQYQDNRYQSPDGGINPHKPEWGNSFRDVWHASGVAHGGLVIGCTFGLATGRQKVRHKLLDVGIGMVIRSTASWAAYNYLR